ncbi:MATE family efflux transporter [Halosimplex sp. TS25]|uniref:MATE family efflux transporter n=1 Tax=Halosimplex rarum TaxID=3396619 RepID=UPI0039E78324
MSSAGDRAVNLTDGKLLKPLLVLSVPIIATNLLQVGYNLADTFWVGRLGQAAVTALSFSWAIVFLLISFSGGFAVAGNVLVAQNKGAENDDRVDHVAGQTLAFVALLSAVFAGIGYLLAPQLLELIGAVPGTAEYRLSVEYTRTMFLGIPFVFGFFIFQGLLQGWGDTRTPMYLMALGVALNVAIDPIFILGFQDNVLFEALGLNGLQRSLYAATGFTGFGVQGAALATILSRGIGTVIAMGLLLTGRVGITPAPGDFVPKRETVAKIVRIGAPASIEQSTRAVGVTVLTALVALASQEAVAAYGIGNRLTSLVFLPAMGLARGTETVVGQNLGADQVERAKRAVVASVGLIAVVLGVVSAVVIAFARPITAVFITGENAELVISVGADYLRIVGFTFLFLGAFRVVQGAFRGSGSTRTAMAFSVLALVVFRVPPAYALVEWFDMGATGVWYGIAFSNVAIFLVAGAWFLRGTWTDAVIDHGSSPSGPDADGPIPASDDVVAEDD